MSEPPAISPTDASQPVTLVPETFSGTLLRRLRYAAAVALSALLMGTVGLYAAGPPASVAGMSLLIWPGHMVLLSLLVLALLLLLATAIGALLCHPDSPHQGLWCALLGLVALSVRGGTSLMIIRSGQLAGPDAYASICHTLALECVYWTVLFLIAEMFARLLHDRFLPNTRWITRISPEAGAKMVRAKLAGPADVATRVSFPLARPAARFNLPTPLAGLLAFLLAMIVGCLLLALTLQSQEKGQVVAACFFSFLAAAFIAGAAFPNVPALVLFLAVPATAVVGYLYAAGYPGVYPGHAGSVFPRALPIDFFAAGIPGAISGYYAAFHVALHSSVEEKA
mgnify:CR=1 FL=1